jgi:tetratricopeptide (TPR) repeat protein
LADFLGAIRVDERGIERELQSDGLQMFKAPFISDREIASSIADTHLSEGWEYLQQQEYSQAIKSFYTALTIDSNLVSAYQGTALIYQYLLDYPAAIENFSQVVNLNISNTLAYLYRGICYFDWGKDTNREDETYVISYEKALDDFNTAMTIDRTFVSAYYPRAAINYYLENLDLALASYSKIIELSSSSSAYYNRAIIWWETSEDRLALADLDRAIDLNPHFVAAYYWRGNLYYQLGDETRGLDEYELAQSIEIETALIPEDEHGFYSRGVARARQGDRVGAMVDLHTAADLCARHKNTITTRHIRSAIDRWNLV